VVEAETRDSVIVLACRVAAGLLDHRTRLFVSNSSVAGSSGRCRRDPVLAPSECRRQQHLEPIRNSRPIIELTAGFGGHEVHYALAVDQSNEALKQSHPLLFGQTGRLLNIEEQFDSGFAPIDMLAARSAAPAEAKLQF